MNVFVLCSELWVVFATGRAADSTTLIKAERTSRHLSKLDQLWLSVTGDRDLDIDETRTDTVTVTTVEFRCRCRLTEMECSVMEWNGRWNDTRRVGGATAQN